jgi:uracil-DNA glycosylase
MTQFSLLLEAPEVRESVADVVRELREKAPCQNCRLSLLHPNNRGVMYRGNPDAKIAVLDIAPRSSEMSQGSPLVGKAGQEFEKWMRYLNIVTKTDIFVSQIVQCQPPQRKDKDGKSSQRMPLPDEIGQCWYPRTLRMIQAMPNLECVITLGFSAAKAMLGGDPISKSHEGRWFVSSLLPGIPVFCLDHPEESLAKPTPEKKGKTKVILDCFRREYLITKKVIEIGKNTSLQDL